MAHFFATVDDLLPILSELEARREIAYTLMGHFSNPEVISRGHGSDLPTLYEAAPYESAAACPSYLITEANCPVKLRELSSREGHLGWAVDQLQNPDSTVLWHGGVFESRLLLCGRVATASKTSVSSSLQRAFESLLRKRFGRIKAFYIGCQAEKLLDAGFRLTGAAQSPPEYDLCR